MSIEAQSYAEIELLVFITEDSNVEMSAVMSDLPRVKVIKGSATKSAARNLLTDAATGEFMLYLDHDMKLSSRFISTCVETTMNGDLDGVTVEVRESRTKNVISWLRAFERSLLATDPAAEVPIFLRLSTVRTLGAFDEELDPLDDWALTLKLRRNGARIGSAKTWICLRESANIRDLFMRKYQRGLAIPALKRAYPDASFLRFGRRFRQAYVRNWQALLRHPAMTVGLLGLKCIEMLGLWLGSLRAGELNCPQDGVAPYFERKTAVNYDRIRLGSNYQLYKHERELAILGSMTQLTGGRVLEVGCGTGRITSALASLSARLIPMDPSDEMLMQYCSKPNLPAPVRADGRAIPFPEKHFSTVVSLRVIWHLSDPLQVRRMLRELCRVSRHDVILDIANRARWELPIVRILTFLPFALDRVAGRAHKSTTLLSLDEVAAMASANGFVLSDWEGLESAPPIVLNLVPKSAASRLYGTISRIDSLVSKVVPPGRYLIRLTRL